MNTAIDTDTDTAHTVDPPADASGSDGQPCLLVHLNADATRSTVETLLRLDEFFRRHADDVVHVQLRAFCAGLGWHPVSAATALLDQLGLHAWSLQRALDAAEAAPPVRHPATIDSATKETA